MLLITGGAGYVGSHFIHELIRRSPQELIVVDNLSEGHRESLRHPDSRLVDCGIGDFDKLDDIFEEYEIDAVVHFAANAYVGESQEKPFKYFQNNVNQSIKLFQTMDRHSVRKIVFSSTCATYGNPEYLPIDEQHPQRPVNVYGTTKLIVENILRSLADTKKWSFMALRYFNAAGAASDGTIGESHDPETHLIPLVLQAASGKNVELKVNGDDYDTRDGTCIRDYVHVTDLAAAHITAVEMLRNGHATDYINLGTEHGASIKEVIAQSRDITGKDIPFTVGPRRPGDPPMLVAKAAKAAKVLGWQAQHDLKSIITTAWNWEKNRTF